MSAFDPYHVWLGIPPSEQPPNYYRLLALALFEASAEVIENAAERQMAHVRRAAHGKHADESQRLLNEISAAQRALLDSSRKAKYDAELREKLSPTARGVAQTIEYTPVIKPPPRTELPVAQPAAPPAKWKQSPKSASPIAETTAAAPLATFAAPSLAAPARLPRARAKQKFPVLLVAVLAIAAILPVLALVAALGFSGGGAVVADNDHEQEASTLETETSSPARETRPALPTTVADDEERPLPRPGEGSPETTTPAAHTAGDDRDPFDNSASFGRTSGQPAIEQTLTISARTLLPRLAFFSLPAEARTPVEVKAGQIVKLKIEGQWRIAANEPRGVSALYIAVGHPGQPATQFAQGASEVEFNVQKAGWLFMGIEDLLNFDNTGEMTVEVRVY